MTHTTERGEKQLLAARERTRATAEPVANGVPPKTQSAPVESDGWPPTATLLYRAVEDVCVRSITSVYFLILKTAILDLVDFICDLFDDDNLI